MGDSQCQTYGLDLSCQLTTAGDSLAVASEQLPSPAPLGMRMSLEDMDYLTILRPPPVRPSTPRPAATKKRNKDSNRNKVVVKRKPQQQGGKAPVKGSKQKTRQKGVATTTPAPPPSAAASPAFPGPYPMYDTPAHPLGYGYGYSGYDYPRYPDHIMTHDYQQVSEWQEVQCVFAPAILDQAHIFSM